MSIDESRIYCQTDMLFLKLMTEKEIANFYITFM